MLPIAGQTAGQNWLNFLRGPMGTLWGKIGKKIDIFFNFEKKNFVSEIPRALRLV